ncbi:hypothetical protein SSPIM334S_04380 [Streptomyces spiroverticillatus]
MTYAESAGATGTSSTRAVDSRSTSIRPTPAGSSPPTELCVTTSPIPAAVRIVFRLASGWLASTGTYVPPASSTPSAPAICSHPFSSTTATRWCGRWPCAVSAAATAAARPMSVA